jgi:hypothetical protein
VLKQTDRSSIASTIQSLIVIGNFGVNLPALFAHEVALHR